MTNVIPNPECWLTGRYVFISGITPVLTVVSLCDPLDPWRQACAPWQCDNGAQNPAHTVSLSLSHKGPQSFKCLWVTTLSPSPMAFFFFCPFSWSFVPSLSDTWKAFTPQVCIWVRVKYQILSATITLTRTWPTKLLQRPVDQNVTKERFEVFYWGASQGQH